jgi:hypothetical protein
MLTKEQIQRIEKRYNHLKAITSSKILSDEIRDKAMEARCQIEENVFHLGYLVSTDTKRFYLKEIADDK